MGLVEVSANKASTAIQKASAPQPAPFPTLATGSLGKLGDNKNIGQPAPFPTQSTGELGKLTDNANKAKGALAGVSGAVGTLGRSLLSLAAPIGVMMALGSAISWVTGKYIEKKKSHDEMMKSVKDMQKSDIEAVTTNKERTDELIDSYRDLNAQREKNKDTARWSLEQEKEYLSVSKELGDIFPSLVERIGSKGEVHLKNVEAIDEEIKRVKELARLEDLSAIKNEEDVYKDGIKEADEIRRKLEEAEKMLSTARNTSENSNIGWSRERAEKTIPDLQSQIVYYDKLLSGFNSNLNNQVNEMSQKFLDMNNVIEGVALESANMYSALDFSNMNTSEISDTRKMLDAFSIARSNAFENNDIVAFNSATKGMSQYLRDELGLTREEVRELVSHFSTFEEKMNNVSNSSE